MFHKALRLENGLLRTQKHTEQTKNLKLHRKLILAAQALDEMADAGATDNINSSMSLHDLAGRLRDTEDDMKGLSACERMAARIAQISKELEYD